MVNYHNDLEACVFNADLTFSCSNTWTQQQFGDFSSSSELLIHIVVFSLSSGLLIFVTGVNAFFFRA